MNWTTTPPGKHDTGWYWAVWCGSALMVYVGPELPHEDDGCVNMENDGEVGHAKSEFAFWMGPIVRPDAPKEA